MISREQEQELFCLFGRSAWRECQKELVECLLAGRNCLGVLPTGHGKSFCFQAAALLAGGCSVVVSPLIALMRDQEQGLRSLGLAVARFDSTLEADDRAQVLADLAAGTLQLLYVAPESLEAPALLEALERAGQGGHLRFFVVDEAHCVSEWGHSFRPDYLKLPAFSTRFPFVALMAITATANLRVQADLRRAFIIAEADSFALPPERANIQRLVSSPANKMTALHELLQAPSARPAIIYCRSRKATEALANELQALGYAAAPYHAGLNAELREQLQDAFLSNAQDVLVATIAFGMGIDKPDVRTVVHYHPPASPESYLQESGRAGRDGEPARSLVMMDGADAIEARNRIAAEEPDAEGLIRCARWILPAHSRVISLWELGVECDIPDDVLPRILTRLEGQLEQRARGYKYYKVKALYPLSTICDGRDAQECARLQHLAANPEGEVDELCAPDAWDCDYSEAMDYLRECEAAGEWKITFRQQALYLINQSDMDARDLADELQHYYAQRKESALVRLQELESMLTAAPCLNAAMHQYFMGERVPPCGHCGACQGQKLVLQPAPTPPALPENWESQMPPLDRLNQRRRLLLGIASPLLMRRRLWGHALYGAAQGYAWDDLV